MYVNVLRIVEYVQENNTMDTKITEIKHLNRKQTIFNFLSPSNLQTKMQRSTWIKSHLLRGDQAQNDGKAFFCKNDFSKFDPLFHFRGISAHKKYFIFRLMLNPIPPLLVTISIAHICKLSKLPEYIFSAHIINPIDMKSFWSDHSRII